MKEQVYVIIDTNVALHYQRLDKITWENIFKDEHIILIITPILIRELEKNKVHNSSRKLRQRATGCINWLTDILEDETKKTIRNYTEIYLLDSEPNIDFSCNNLLTTVTDDHFVAAAIDIKAKGKVPLFIATNDLGLKMKLKSRKLEYLSIPEEFLLQEEKDPIEKENADLKRQLIEIKSKEPIFELSINSEGGVANYLVKDPLCPRDIYVAKDLKEIKQKHPLLIVEVRKEPEPPFVKGKGFDLSSLGFLERTISPQECEKYNDKLVEFYNKSEEYLVNLWDFLERNSLARICSVSLHNIGTAPASDVDIVLSFPNFIKIFDTDSYPKKPKPPEPPSKPGVLRVGDALSRDFYGINNIDSSVMRNLHNINASSRGPSISEKKKQVSFWIKHIKHHMQFKPDPFLICFESRDAVKNFSASYVIYSVETPKPTNGEFHFVVEHAPRK